MCKSSQATSETKFNNLDKAYNLVKELDQDSSKIDSLFKISNQFYSLKKNPEFEMKSFQNF